MFIDTGILVAYQNIHDRYHARAKALMDGIRRGECGTPYVSDYVFDEAVTTALVRTGRTDIAAATGELVLGSPRKTRFITMLRVHENEFLEAWKLFGDYTDRGLSFTDCTSITLMRDLKLDQIASFDHGFDGILSRLE